MVVPLLLVAPKAGPTQVAVELVGDELGYVARSLITAE
jgi:hypothetical protein